MVLFGHRGAAGEAPENTLAGFAYARRVGVRAFELDIRLSADSELVVLHDESPLRTTGVPGVVGDFTAAQLAALDARGIHTGWPEPAGIPTLAQVLAAHPDLDAYQIEIKRAAPVALPLICRKLAALLAEMGVKERVVVSSFEPEALAAMAAVDPHQPLAYIGAYDSPAWVERAVALGCVGACIPLKSGTQAVVDAAHAAGLQVTGWLGNSEDDLARLLDWGVESITTDFPSRALAYLANAPTP